MDWVGGIEGQGLEWEGAEAEVDCLSEVVLVRE